MTSTKERYFIKISTLKSQLTKEKERVKHSERLLKKVNSFLESSSAKISKDEAEWEEAHKLQEAARKVNEKYCSEIWLAHRGGVISGAKELLGKLDEILEAEK